MLLLLVVVVMMVNRSFTPGWTQINCVSPVNQWRH